MSINLRFSGTLAPDNSVSMRALSKSLFNLQKAVDRSYLDIERNGLLKNEKMHKRDYERVVLYFRSVEQRSFGIGFREAFPTLKDVFDRLGRAINPPYEEAKSQSDLELSKYLKQVDSKKSDLENGDLEIKSYRELISSPSEQVIRQFSERAIANYINQMLVPVRKDSGNGAIELKIEGNQSYSFDFDQRTSKRFNKITRIRSLDQPTIVTATMIEMNNQTFMGKIYNVDTKKDSRIYFKGFDDFEKLASFVSRKGEEFKFIGAPILEYGSRDLYAGDIFFLDLERNNG